MTTKNNTPAFPVPSYVNASGETHDSAQSGMTLRQWYAGMALQGMLASDAHPDIELGELMASDADIAHRAAFAFKLADAMLRHERASAPEAGS